MSGSDPVHRRTAFTLIELLVVVAILTLLVLLLMPFLARARELAMFAACKSNMKNAGTAWFGFAASRGDRFPGQGISRYEWWGVFWPQILNREWFQSNASNCYPTSAYGDEPTCGPLVKFWDFWGASQGYNNQDLGKKYMTCTKYKAWTSSSGGNNLWTRPWLANDHAVAGHYDDYSETYVQLTKGGSESYQDGIRVPNSQLPNQVYNSQYQSPQGDQCFYDLGRKTEAWSNPSITYLMWESEAGDDMNSYVQGVANSDGSVTLNVNQSNLYYPPWTAESDGEMAFRHMLPVDMSLWQSEARMGALYVDGHVGEWGPSTPHQYTPANFNP